MQLPVEHTIVGVSTSVTAFVGYTQRGATNEPTQLYSYGDFERAFGGLHLDSPVSYAVQQFFQNDGLEGTSSSRATTTTAKPRATTTSSSSLRRSLSPATGVSAR